MRTLFYKRRDGSVWYEVFSPSGTYGRHGSLEAYQKWLEEERGLITKVTGSNDIIKWDLPKGWH